MKSLCSWSCTTLVGSEPSLGTLLTTLSWVVGLRPGMESTVTYLASSSLKDVGSSCQAVVSILAASCVSSGEGAGAVALSLAAAAQTCCQDTWGSGFHTVCNKCLLQRLLVWDFGVLRDMSCKDKFGQLQGYLGLSSKFWSSASHGSLRIGSLLHLALTLLGRTNIGPLASRTIWHNNRSGSLMWSVVSSKPGA